jgi:hypothetical protein
MKNQILFFSFICCLSSPLVHASDFKYYCVSDQEKSFPKAVNPNITLEISNPWISSAIPEKKQISFKYEDGVDGTSYPVAPYTQQRGLGSAFPEVADKDFAGFSTLVDGHSLRFEKEMLSGSAGGFALIRDTVQSGYGTPVGKVLYKAYRCAKK